MPRIFLLPFLKLDISQKLKTFLRGNEFVMALLAALVGLCAGAVVSAMGYLSRLLHSLVFSIPFGDRLSAAYSVDQLHLLIGPIVGGSILAIIFVVLKYLNKKPMVDPMEANALHGGRMSLIDSAIVSVQNIISNGFGASVGLEAGFTQLSSGIASRFGQALALRRNDLRILVGCGSAGAISAAFHAPLTGAFYAFELIIGTYTILALAPVIIAAIAATTVSNFLSGSDFTIEVGKLGPVVPVDFLPAILLGVLASLIGILLMLCVSSVEVIARKSTIPVWLRPVLGGIVVGLLALVTPQVLSAGHGAMHLDLPSSIGIVSLITIITLKSFASAISIGSGFRGGLFFASLFLGSLIGKLFSAVAIVFFQEANLTPMIYAVIGMSAFATTVIGGPLTMTFLALEVTGNLPITALVLASTISASLIVRTLFGFSFSTWRFHLRGENVKSPQDIGWIRNLTVDQLMRTDVKTISLGASVSEFKEKFPLGSTQRVIVIGANDQYAGIIYVPDIYSSLVEKDQGSQSIARYVKLADQFLIPQNNAQIAAVKFEENECEALAVINNPFDKQVIGLLSEAYTLRRYSEEMDSHRREVFGDY